MRVPIIIIIVTAANEVDGNEHVRQLFFFFFLKPCFRSVTQIFNLSRSLQVRREIAIKQTEFKVFSQSETNYRQLGLSLKSRSLLMSSFLRSSTTATCLAHPALAAQVFPPAELLTIKVKVTVDRFLQLQEKKNHKLLSLVLSKTLWKMTPWQLFWPTPQRGAHCDWLIVICRENAGFKVTGIFPQLSL